MNYTKNFSGFVVVVLLQIFAATLAYAQQPLLQITAPANNSLATEGTTITITVAADSSVQIVGVIAESPLPDVQGTSSPNQFTLTLPINIPPGLYKLTAVGTNASGDVESVPIAIDVERQFFSVSLTVSTNASAVFGPGAGPR